MLTQIILIELQIGNISSTDFLYEQEGHLPRAPINWDFGLSSSSALYYNFSISSTLVEIINYFPFLHYSGNIHKLKSNSNICYKFCLNHNIVY